MLNRNRIRRALPRCRCERAARLWLRDNADRLQPVPLRARALNDQRPVQMLTALCRKVHPRRIQQRLDRTVAFQRRIKAGRVPDDAAHDLRGRASHHENISLFQPRDLQQLLYRRCRLLCNFSHRILLTSCRCRHPESPV